MMGVRDLPPAQTSVQFGRHRFARCRPPAPILDAGDAIRSKIMSMTDDDCRTCKIRDLNDTLRTTGGGGRLLITPGVVDRGEAFIVQAMTAMREHDEFSEENDPYGEHDFGRVVIDDQPVLWKIDYYDPTLKYGSDDPTDPEKTTRVLTLFLAEEY
jgi:hypothetical protein